MLRVVKILQISLTILMVLGGGCIEYGPPGRPKVIPQAITFLVSSSTKSAFTPCGCHGAKWGGLPRRGSIFAQAAEEVEWDVITVDTGDVVQGTPAGTTVLKNKYIFQAYGVIGYDAVNIGDNDLALGYEELARIGTENNIPWLSANTYSTGVFPDLPPGIPGGPSMVPNPSITPPVNGASGNDPAGTDVEGEPEPLFSPYKIVEPAGAPGYKIGIIGMMIQDGGLLNRERETFSFEPYDIALARTVEQLREVEKVDLVVLLCDSNSFQNMDTHTLFAGVDVVIGGNTRLGASPNYNLNPLNPMYREEADPRRPTNPPGQQTGATPGSPPAQDQETEEEPEYVIEPLDLPIVFPMAGSQGKRLARYDIIFDANGRIIDYFTKEYDVSEQYPDDPMMAEITMGYDTEVLSQELTDKVSRNFAGSAACEQCHPGYLAAWSDFGHFHSHERIETEGKLEDRECTRCHAIGFVEEGRLLTYDMIPESYRNVGCEGCHTNGQRHITLQEQLARRSPELRATTTVTDSMETEILMTLCTDCHKGQYGQGFDFAAAMEAARAICLHVPPAPTRPPAE